MKIKYDKQIISIKKMIRKKQITIIKIKIKFDIKIKLNQIQWVNLKKKNIQNKIYSNKKFKDQI